MNQRHRRLRRTIIMVVAIPLIGILILSLVLIVIPGVYNEWRVQRFAAPFFDYPLPPNTVEMNRKTEVGVLSGNGNHCDFRATRTLLTDLSEAEIKSYYRDVGFPPVEPRSSSAAISGLNGLIRVGVYIEQKTPSDGRTKATVEVLDIGLYPPVGIQCR